MAVHQLLKCSPCFFVRDPKAATEFYGAKLGFDRIELFGDQEKPFFAIACRDDAMIMFRYMRDGRPERPWYPEADDDPFDAYIHVSDVGTLFEELKGVGVAVSLLTEVPYSMLEIIVTDLDGYVLRFGQDTSTNDC